MPGATLGMADGPQENGVVGAQLSDRSGGQDFLRPQVAFAAEIVVGQLIGKTFQLGDCVQHLQGFRRNFRTRPVAADNCDLHSCSLPIALEKGGILMHRDTTEK